MISSAEATRLILEHTFSSRTEELPFGESLGRILAEDICADRDFPPFDRVTKDGIALNTDGFDFDKGLCRIEAVVGAGEEQYSLRDASMVVEIMTGAPLPKGTDAVVMYEQLEKNKNGIHLRSSVKRKQNIHPQGQDAKKGQPLLKKGRPIRAAEIGLLASTGHTTVKVYSWPRIVLIATGNELVLPHQTPDVHQIRVSNVYTLQAALKEIGVPAAVEILQDDKTILSERLQTLLKTNDVLICSGGVSKGRFDFLPDIFPQLGIQKVFHRVAQRPGKPLWFGFDKSKQKFVFALPGNPASTYSNFLLYVLPWLRKSFQLPTLERTVIAGEEIQNSLDLTRHIRVQLSEERNTTVAHLVKNNGSGDLVSLTEAQGLVSLLPGQTVPQGSPVPFCPFKPQL